MFDVWCLMYDIWCMMYDIWYMIYDIWYMIYAICSMLYALCYMLYAICYMIYDIWYMMVCLHLWRRGLRLSRVSRSLCPQQHQMVIDAWVTVQKSYYFLWHSQLLCDRDGFSVFFFLIQHAGEHEDNMVINVGVLGWLIATWNMANWILHIDELITCVFICFPRNSY